MGSASGTVLLFDHKQVLRAACTPGEKSQLGAVTCLALSNDQTTLVVGYSKGHVCVHACMTRVTVQVARWDVAAGKVLNTISDVHCGHAVTQVSCTDDPNHIISVNTSVRTRGFLLQLTCPRALCLCTISRRCWACGSSTMSAFTDPSSKSLHAYDAQRLFQNRRSRGAAARHAVRHGQVRREKPESAGGQHVCRHADSVQGACTVLSVDTHVPQLVIAMIRPETKNLLTVLRQDADGAANPTAQWHACHLADACSRAPRRMSLMPDRLQQHSVVVPVLAFSWGVSVRLLRVEFSIAADPGKKPLKFTAMGTFRSKHDIVNIQWLNDHTLLLMDAEVPAITRSSHIITHLQDHANIVDTATMTLVDLVDLSKIEVVRARFPLSLNLLLQTRSSRMLYDGSIDACDGSVHLLGRNTMHVVHLVDWRDRISSLVAASHFVDALALTLAFYDDKAVAVSGLPQVGAYFFLVWLLSLFSERA